MDSTQKFKLKNLSQRVLTIVETHPGITYKDIAEYLLQSIHKSSLELKQHDNIKRRVYDALNVMIAIDIIFRKQKKIYFNKIKLQRLQYFKKKKIECQEKIKEGKHLLQTIILSKQWTQQRLKKTDIKINQKCFKRPIFILLLKKSSLLEKDKDWIWVRSRQKIEFYQDIYLGILMNK